MFHKSNLCKCRLARPMSSIYEPVRKIVAEDVDGVTVERAVVVPVDVCSREAELSLPKASDYTLEKLIKAGVDLQRIDVMPYFASTDAFDAEMKQDRDALDLFNQLKETEKDVEPEKTVE